MDKQIKERGITFNAEMVRAILSGNKTQTRRVMKVQPVLNGSFYEVYGAGWGKSIRSIPAVTGHSLSSNCPFGKVGDRLYVRETWSDVNYEGSTALAYRADGELKILNEDDGDDSDLNFEKYQFANWYPDLIEGTEGRWRPSIHMPRWASRITLEITDVRVERLQDISTRDALAEGLHQLPASGRYCLAPGMQYFGEASHSAKEVYSWLWESIYGEDSWQSNPFVWVISFRQVEAAL